MSTVFEITIAVSTSAEAARARDVENHAFDEIARLEDILSEWRAQSPVSRVNAAAGERSVEVPPELLEVVERSLEISRLSDGLFDVTWAALRGLWDFRSHEGRPPSAFQVGARLPLVNYRDVVVDHAHRTVMLRRRGMAIGLGGIAKGYALDRAEAILRGAGFTSFILYAGGQVQVRGTKGGRPWRVGIRNPRNADAYFAWFETTGAAISTSGDYEHYFVHEGRMYHHILDPPTGFPARASTSVTVITQDGTSADGFTKPIFILGPERGLEFARRVGVETVIVDERLRVTASPGLRGHLNVEPMTPPAGP